MKKKKWIIWGLLIALLISQYTSCSADKISEESNATQSEALLPPPRYVIYVGYEDDTTLDDLIPSNSSAIRNPLANDKRFSVTATTETGYTDSSTHKSEVTIDGKTYSLNYTESYKIALSANKEYSQYSCFDKYSFELDGTRGSVTTNNVTGEIAGFLDYTIDEEAEGPMTRKEAREKADTLLSVLYGEDIFDYYKYDKKCEWEDRAGYYFVFRRDVYGIPSNDAIAIWLNANGEVKSIHALTKGHCYKAESELTQAYVDAARAELRKLYSDKYTVGEIALAVDVNGDYYLETSISYYADDEQGNTLKHNKKLYLSIR